MTGPAADPGALGAPRPTLGRYRPATRRPDPARDSGVDPADGDTAAGGFSGDIVDEWGKQSFPASDPPANW